MLPLNLPSQMQSSKHKCWQKHAIQMGQASRLQPCAPALEKVLLLNAPSSLCKSIKTGLHLVRKGIKLSFVPIQHRPHNKASILQWQKRVRIVKRMHMLASVSADATTGILPTTSASCLRLTCIQYKAWESGLKSTVQ